MPRPSMLGAAGIVSLVLTISEIDAASVDYVGVDITTNDAWRTTTVSKNFDPDGDNIYGTDGYEAGEWGGSSPPSYVNLGYFGSNFVGEVYATPDDPDLTGPGPVPNVPQGGDHYRFGDDLPAEQDLFSIEVTETRQFRLAILTDINASFAIGENPDGLRVRQVSGGAADSGLIAAGATGPDHDADIDYYFFDIAAQPGDVFIVSGRNDLTWMDNGIGGLTFDTIPEPSALVLVGIAVFHFSTYRQVKLRRPIRRQMP